MNLSNLYHLHKIMEQDLKKLTRKNCKQVFQQENRAFQKNAEQHPQAMQGLTHEPHSDKRILSKSAMIRFIRQRMCIQVNKVEDLACKAPDENLQQYYYQNASNLLHTANDYISYLTHLKRNHNIYYDSSLHILNRSFAKRYMQADLRQLEKRVNEIRVKNKLEQEERARKEQPEQMSLFALRPKKVLHV